MKLEELEVYQLAMELAERIWQIVLKWSYFEKDTIGKQFIKAADSIAANLSEGFGRYYYKENKQFCYYSRGSLFETKTFLKKSHLRNLIDEKTFTELSQQLEILGVKLNNYIGSIGRKAANQE